MTDRVSNLATMFTGISSPKDVSESKADLSPSYLFNRDQFVALMASDHVHIDDAVRLFAAMSDSSREESDDEQNELYMIVHNLTLYDDSFCRGILLASAHKARHLELCAAFMLAGSNAPDQLILTAFISSKLPELPMRLRGVVLAYLNVAKPIVFKALMDHYLPDAGEVKH